jgi:hypothetical protein
MTMTLTLCQTVTNYLAASIMSDHGLTCEYDFGDAAVNDSNLYDDLLHGYIPSPALNDRVLKYMNDNEPSAPIINLFADGGPLSQFN